MACIGRCVSCCVSFDGIGIRLNSLWCGDMLVLSEPPLEVDHIHFADVKVSTGIVVVGVTSFVGLLISSLSFRGPCVLCLYWSLVLTLCVRCAGG